MTYCAKCGTKNEDDAAFCKKCGSSLNGAIKRTHDKDDDCVCSGSQQNPMVPIFWGVVIILIGLWIIISFVIPKDIDGLTIVSTGHYRDNATELLSSNRMMEFVESIHRRDPRKIILIDSSPLLQTTESRALAAIAGQIVLVVHAGVTPKGAVIDASSELDTSKPINLVLNQVRHSSRSHYYGGYYGGGYGAAYGETDELKNSKK